MIRDIFVLVVVGSAIGLTCLKQTHASEEAKWQHPLVKRGYLNSPLVEVLPFVFKDELHVLENWRSNWHWPEQPSATAAKNNEMWIARLPGGPEHWNQRVHLSYAMADHSLGCVLVWEDTAYVFGVNEQSGRTQVDMTWSNDLVSWAEPVKVFDSPFGQIFNVSITRDDRGFVFLWETDGIGTPFTMCFGRIDHITQNWNENTIANAYYGADKYTGGPAIFYEGGQYFLLYLESLGGGRFETQITRSQDLIHWQDAPRDRPFVTFDMGRQNIPLLPPEAVETNASDSKLIYFDDQVVVYYTGSNQQVGGDLQWATFAGKKQELFERFFEGLEQLSISTNPPVHSGDWGPILIAPTTDIDRQPAGLADQQDVRPSAAQLSYQNDQLGAFVHFGLATYTQSDMHSTPDPSIFNPVDLDAEQWVLAAKSFGAKHIVLTAKHHNGFCLWPTETTGYSVKQSPWKNGKGDVVRELADACQKHELKLGLYISGADRHMNISASMAPIGERVLEANNREDYFRVYTRQLTELLTGYGDLAVIWFDGAWDPFGWDVKDPTTGEPIGTAHGDAIAALVREKQPGAVIFQGTQPDVRWSGSEQGWAAYPLWNVVKAGEGPKHYLSPQNSGWFIPEACMHTRSTWFWVPESDTTLRSLESLMQAYYESIGRGANLLVNLTPDTTGRIPEAEVQLMVEFGETINKRFGTLLASINSDEDWSSPGELVLDLPQASSVDHVILEEEIARGQNIRAYAIDARIEDNWTSIAKGQSIGRKRIERFEPVRANALRLRILEADATPHVRLFGTYDAGSN